MPTFFLAACERGFARFRKVLISVVTLTAKYSDGDSEGVVSDDDDDNADDDNDDDKTVAGGLGPDDLTSNGPDEEVKPQDDIAMGGWSTIAKNNTMLCAKTYPAGQCSFM